MTDTDKLEPGAEDETVCRAFLLTADLANARGLPETWAPGCVASFAIDPDWSVKINRSRDEQDSIPGFHAAYEHKGWSVALLSPHGGTIALGMEDRLIAALEAAIIGPRLTPPGKE
ncbi:MAG: hypothetical protein WC869_11765 [Phycisphaerae bacterium]